MKSLYLVLCILLLSAVVSPSVLAQSEKSGEKKSQSNTGIVATGVAIYWKTLSAEEKNTFLTGYLMSHYDILRAMENLSSSDNRKVKGIQTDLEQTVAYFRINSYDERQRFIELIDQYYRRKTRLSGSFEDALQYAYRLLHYENRDSVQAQ